MELQKSDFSEYQIKHKTSKKKIFTLIKKRREAVELINTELYFLNEVFFDLSYNVDVNLKLNELRIYKDENLPEKDLVISNELDKKKLILLLEDYLLVIKLNKKV